MSDPDTNGDIDSISLDQDQDLLIQKFAKTISTQEQLSVQPLLSGMNALELESLFSAIAVKVLRLKPEDDSTGDGIRVIVSECLKDRGFQLGTSLEDIKKALAGVSGMKLLSLITRVLKSQGSKVAPQDIQIAQERVMNLQSYNKLLLSSDGTTQSENNKKENMDEELVLLHLSAIHVANRALLHRKHMTAAVQSLTLPGSIEGQYISHKDLLGPVWDLYRMVEQNRN